MANQVKGETVQYTATLVDANSANTDVAIISGLPAKYVIRKITAYDASGAITLATFDVRTAASGGGTALVTAFLLNGLSAAAKFIDMTLAAVLGTDYQTASTLYVRNVTANGSARTFSILFEIQTLV